ncbi:MAG: hypothetical protein ACJATI_000818 [Halioglobus sp.]|jgi:hypothetical protein
MLVENLKGGLYRFNRQKREDSLFLENRIYIDQFLATEKRIFPAIDSKIIYCSQRNMFENIKRILETILIANNIEYKIINNQPKSRFTIVSEGNKYEIDFFEDIKNSIKTDPKGWFVNVDYSLINNWINPIRQIFIDQKLNILCGADNWIELFIPNPDVDDYYSILEQYPELQIVKGHMYISCYSEVGAMGLVYGVGLESHHSNKDEIYEQCKLSSFVITGGITLADYVTTNQKRAFLSFVFKNKKNF